MPTTLSPLFFKTKKSRARLQFYPSAARLSLLEDPALSVPSSRRVWLYRSHEKRGLNSSSKIKPITNPSACQGTLLIGWRRSLNCSSTTKTRSGICRNSKSNLLHRGRREPPPVGRWSCYRPGSCSGRGISRLTLVPFSIDNTVNMPPTSAARFLILESPLPPPLLHCSHPTPSS